METADNKIEIKLITDYREYLLSKIESLKVSLDQITSSFGNEITSSIDEFSKRINGKLKIIDERFTKNTEELETLRAELLSKKFDESNFNNVSQVRRLDKIVNERDLKIKELESRIRYLESNSPSTSAYANANANANTNENIAKKEPPTHIKQKPATKETKETKETENRPELPRTSESARRSCQRGRARWRRSRLSRERPCASRRPASRRQPRARCRARPGALADARGAAPTSRSSRPASCRSDRRRPPPRRCGRSSPDR